MKGRIPARFAPILFGAILSAIMVSVISAVLLVVADQGLTSGFFVHWSKEFLTTWPIAFPTVLIVAPVVRKWVSYLTSP